MKDDGLGDWRILAATTLAEDLPAAYPGGPSHKAGTPIHQGTAIRTLNNQITGFVTPSAIALSLDIAIKAGMLAQEQFTKLVFDDVITPKGNGKSVGFRNVGPLFDYFENCMVAATFSFQALESFCNRTIADRVKGNYILEKRDGIKKSLTSSELEREASTEEKIAVILPDVLGLESPKGKKVWQNFIKIKRARDSTIHLKSNDQYPNTKLDSEPGEDTLFYQFLNNAPTEFPKASITMINYFLSAKEIPRWFQCPLEFCS